MPVQRLDCFRPEQPLARRGSRFRRVCWHLVSCLVFQGPLQFPNGMKRALLRLFGAKVGRKLYLRPRVNILCPWNLRIGDHVWIGDRCELLNLEVVSLADHVALAHDVYIAAGSHDIHSQRMAYANLPVTIETGCWIATRAFIGPGVVVGAGSVVAACAVVMRSVPAGVIVAGNPARQIKDRVIDRDLVEEA